MSRRLFAFLLSELKAVRVVCPRVECGAVVEVSVRQLALRFDRGPACPVCRREYFGPHTPEPNPLAKLGDALDALQAEARRVEVEFILPDTPD